MFCGKVFTKARQFLRHKCNSNLDAPKQGHVRHRIAELNEKVRVELKKLHNSQSPSRKRVLRALNDGSVRPQKMARTQTDKPSRQRVPWNDRQGDGGAKVPSGAVNSRDSTTTSEIATGVAQDANGWPLDTTVPIDDCLYAFNPDTTMDDYGLYAFENFDVSAYR